jgi:hypothetical protein
LRTEIVADPVLLIKIALPAGFIIIEETSAPSAPKAPLIALNLAVPLSDSDEYLSASLIFCALKFEIEMKATNKINNLFIIEFELYN